jgi:hypothetical protein
VVAECQHEDFAARVEVSRLYDGEGADGPAHFMADITVQCAVCGADFGFRGVPCGISMGQPMVDVTGKELRVPMMSPAEMELRGGLAGMAQPGNDPDLSE